MTKTLGDDDYVRSVLTDEEYLGYKKGKAAEGLAWLIKSASVADLERAMAALENVAPAAPQKQRLNDGGELSVGLKEQAGYPHVNGFCPDGKPCRRHCYRDQTHCLDAYDMLDSALVQRQAV